MVEGVRAPAVSVIIPTFNRADQICRSIDSILRQAFSDLELIIVDDCSTDGTEARVRTRRDPRIRYLRQSVNRGAAAARNSGISAARGEWIAFQDSDDEWLPGKLEKQMALAESAPPGSVIYCGLLRWKGASAVYIPHRGIKARKGSILGQLLLGNFVSTQTLLVRKANLLQVGGFDEQLGRLQDWELAIRLAERCRFLLVDEPLVNAWHSQASISEDSEALAHALDYIFEKHCALFDRIADSRFCILVAFALYNLSQGKTGIARQQLRRSLDFRPRSLSAWSRAVFSYVLPNAYWRLRDRRFRRPDSATAR
jgi:glycosyltransferase involved in cell wall biosynthesis